MQASCERLRYHSDLPGASKQEGRDLDGAPGAEQRAANGVMGVLHHSRSQVAVVAAAAAAQQPLLFT